IPMARARGRLKTLIAYAWPMHRWIASAAGGTSQRLNRGPATIRSLESRPGMRRILSRPPRLSDTIATSYRLARREENMADQREIYMSRKDSWLPRSEEHTSELQSRSELVCRL